VDARDITPFRLSKPFEEHMPDVLDAVVSDPAGLYQVTYRVGPLIVSAQIWQDPGWGQTAHEELSESDREFLREIRVVLDPNSPEQQTTL
jgi:hypothetical protein